MSVERPPVALFAFRRPDHLRATLATLAGAHGASDTDLHVFCDGPRTPEDVDGVTAVRDLARGADGFRSVTVNESEVNRGLAASVMAGVADVLRNHETVIVLEDDMLVAPEFLDYLAEGLALYADEPRVVSIHAFCVVADEPMPQSFFLRGADCWGWATWRRGWAVFDPDGAALLARLDASGEARAFDYDGAYPYRQMLVDQVAGRVDSWAIRWYASAFLAGMLTLYPGRSLLQNIGQDGSGTHVGSSAAHQVPVGRITLPLVVVPVEESASGRAAVMRALRRTHGSGLRDRLRRLVRGGAS